MYPHRIRLRGPWEVEVLEGSARDMASALPRTIPMPARLRDVGFADFAGTVRLTRRFGRPSRLDDTERVWLACAGIDGKAVATLNGYCLGEIRAPFARDVTEHVQERNVLQFELEVRDDQAGLHGEVALEIRRAAYLERVATRQRDGRHHVMGTVEGVCDGPLDLYVLCEGVAVHHQAIAVGQSFDVPVNRPDSRVELVQGATVWYAAEQIGENSGAEL